MVFIALGIDVDDENIDEEVNAAAERYAAKKGITCFLITDFFNTSNGKGVQITIEDRGE